MRVKYIFTAFVFIAMACHPTVSPYGQFGLLLKSAKATNWNTGANGYQGTTYEFEIDNPKRKNVTIKSVWINDAQANVNLNTKKTSFKFSITSSNESSGADWLSVPNPTNAEAYCVIIYKIGDKEFFWVLDKIEESYPAYDHLPE
ncbi:MAG: hypothetical protein ACPGLV_03415 [Bacteroidia bacterium]